MQNTEYPLPYYAKWFTGKTALITGATSGIGREIARLLSSYGSRVILCGRDKEAMENLINELGHDVVVGNFLVDFSNMVSLQAVIAEIDKKYEVDILINNAGLGYIMDFCKMPQDAIHTLNNVNMIAVVEFCRAFLPKMQKRDGTGIINVGSVASFFATPGSALYGATKHFVLGFTDALHHEMLSKGVHVTGIYPGHTYSSFLKRSTDGRKEDWGQAMAPGTVAELALKGLMKNKRRVTPGVSNKIRLLASYVMPVFMISSRVYNKAIKNFPKE